MRELTGQQERVLKVVEEYIDEWHIPPTRKEISDAMGFSSPNAAQQQLLALEKKGFVHLYLKTTRGIIVL